MGMWEYQRRQCDRNRLMWHDITGSGGGYKGIRTRNEVQTRPAISNSLEAHLQLYNITFSYNTSGSMGARFQAYLYLSGPELRNSCEAIPPLHLVSESGISSRSLGV